MLVTKEEQMFQKLVQNVNVTYQKLKPIAFQNMHLQFDQQISSSILVVQKQSQYVPIFSYKETVAFNIVSDYKFSNEFATFVSTKNDQIRYVCQIKSDITLSQVINSLVKFSSKYKAKITLVMGDFTGLTLSYDQTFFDLIGQVVDSLDILQGEIGKVVVTKKFWALFKSKKETFDGLVKVVNNQVHLSLDN
ncbi:Hypothetical_protein [Hexamita inflata]|uniref:Hypothetical_protein n=1 Tax=Hexamita inflata TaxID=28002 RepID=A0ABP1K3J2_9EUKA